MRVADFFCGAGGFSEGFRQAGFRIVFAVDKWLPAYTTYKANKPQTNVKLDDVIRISLLPDDEFEKLVPDTEIIIGSPPCVAFSNSNKSGNGDKELGIELLEAYLRIVARKKFKKESVLKYWILENVPNIKKYIKAEYSAEDLGLTGAFKLRVIGESSKVYNAKYFGVPSNRKRFLCGEFPEPVPTHTDRTVIPMRRILESLGEPNADDRQIITDCNYPDLTLPIAAVTDHQYKYLVADFELEKAIRLKLDKGYMGRMSFPENIDKPSRTVMATMSACSRESMILGCSDGKYRLPTVREIASFMSFPIDYRFYGVSKGIKYTLVGNAVPPKLSNAIANAILISNHRELIHAYPRIQHDTSIPFINLNGIEVPMKTEKTKRADAKFKYHIPYTILNAYRVELTNYHSDFKIKQIKWNAEIHYSQGKDKAKVFIPKADIRKIPCEYQDLVKRFIAATSKKMCSSKKFQLRYCMTKADRNNQMGPYELLNEIKLILDQLIPPELEGINLTLKELPSQLPLKIYIGFYIMYRILRAGGN